MRAYKVVSVAVLHVRKIDYCPWRWSAFSECASSYCSFNVQFGLDIVSKEKKSSWVYCIVFFFLVYLPQPLSSLLSLQSSLWSHTWLEGTQFPLSHLNLPGGQVGAGV